MLVFHGLASSVVDFNPPVVSLDEEPDRTKDRTRKRIRLDDTSALEDSRVAVSRGDDEGTVTLWDLVLEYDLSSITTELNGYELTSVDFHVVNVKNSQTPLRQQQKQIYFSRLPLESRALLLIASSESAESGYLSSILNGLVALTTESGAFVKKVRAAYGSNTHITRLLTLKESKVAMRIRATTDHLITPTTESEKLANDLNFRSLLDLYYPDDTANPVSVTGFYDSLRPPPLLKIPWDPVAGLKTELMQYQKNAVNWMIQRERGPAEQPTLWTTYLEHSEKVVFLQKSLGLISQSANAVSQQDRMVKGGVLADEMGLGKSLEVIATVLQNRRKINDNDNEIDFFTGNRIKAIGATLVVAPHSILHQWLDEIEKHSNLKAFYYQGMACEAEDLSKYDIVVTSYTVLSAELWYAIPTLSSRTLRRPPVHKKRQSPLVKYEFWRVIMDEAQMIQSGQTSAAQVAALIPRTLAWVVTGTPISTSCHDLYGLLHFLRFIPIYGNPRLWTNLLKSPTAAYHVTDLFRPISCRNTKALVSSEISIAKQTKYLCEVNLAPLEEQHVLDTLESAFVDLELDDKGVPFDNDWARVNMSKLHSWLSRVRQACFHYSCGRNYRQLRSTEGDAVQPLEQVLATMLETTERDLESNTRSLLDTHVLHGEVKEYLGQEKEAVKIWLDTVPQLQEAVLRNEAIANNAKSDLDAADGERLTGHALDTGLQGSLQLRSWRTSLHKCLFLLGGVSHRLGNTEEEDEYYSRAKEVRSKILSEAESKAMAKINPLLEDVMQQNFVSIPEIFYPKEIGALLTRETMERLQGLTELLNDQANQLDSWRDECITRLTAPLADQNDDPSGEEYQNSLDLQTEAFSYHELVQFLVSDRVTMITGEMNNLMRANIEQALNNANEENGSIIREGLKIRERLVPPDQTTSLSEIRRQLRMKMRTADSLSSKFVRLELEVAKRALHELDHQYKPQKEAADKLNKEMERLSGVFNARLDYYRQFQAISDHVEQFTVLKKPKPTLIGQQLDELLDRARGRERGIELEESDISNEERSRRVASILAKVKHDVHKSTNAINAGQTRSRYLKFLGQGWSDGPSECLICLEAVELGAFTVCGHIFCRHCFLRWFGANGTCPICKTWLPNGNAFRTIDLSTRSSDKEASDRKSSSAVPSHVNDEHDPKTIYRTLDDDTKRMIGSIELKRSYSTKIDTIVRHLLFLPRGTKSILYSNFSEYLSMIRFALTENGIESSALDHRNSNRTSKTLAAFKLDPDFEVLLMSGKSQSAGLTLIHATNLFIVDPILNPAVEQQIASRIHRVGQTQPTCVYQYVVTRTVEETILKQSVGRRREELQRRAARGEEALDEDSADQQVYMTVASKDSEMVSSAEEAILLFTGSMQRLERRGELLRETNTAA